MSEEKAAGVGKLVCLFLRKFWGGRRGLLAYPCRGAWGPYEGAWIVEKRAGGSRAPVAIALVYAASGWLWCGVGVCCEGRGLAEAASRPSMRFVAVKEAEQQGQAMVLKTRDLLTGHAASSWGSFPKQPAFRPNGQLPRELAQGSNFLGKSELVCLLLCFQKFFAFGHRLLELLGLDVLVEFGIWG